ncbi:transcriptional regulator [Candidatus Arsenophonus triatominarum]|uniref:transcriptional regulator n=1 Tax=Candidatus Arsenophonus triatominarum TaxID=57911 RepID=UPI0007C529FE|nr:YdaS family helix-turn-helix protein [Candidatus Arsenophonus triatominarum]
MNGLQKAILEMGSSKTLAQNLGLSQMSISKWKNKYKGRVPVDRVLAIYELTGITPHELRPDLYLNPTDGIPADKQNAI